MQYQQTLKAGIPAILPIYGRAFVLESTGAAASIALTFRGPGLSDEIFERAKRGRKLRLLEGGFTSIQLIAPVDCTVEFTTSENAVDLDFADGSAVTVTGQVDLTRGTPGNTLFVTGVSLSDAPATAASAGAAVPVTSAGQVIRAADANRRELRFANLGPDPVAIGPVGQTWAQRCIVIQPGDIWIESRGANLAWSGVCDAAQTASVTAQGVNA